MYSRLTVIGGTLLAVLALGTTASASSPAGSESKASASGSGSADARSARHIRVMMGMGDQGTSMFDHPAYRALNIKKVRYFIHWNAIDKPLELAKADAYVAAARRAGARVLLHISTDDLRPRRGRLPSVRAYRQKVGRLVRRYMRQGVREYGVWNEADHNTQPTFRNPRRAAQYFVAMRRVCKGCRIVALDVLDSPKARSYTRRFYRALSPANRLRANIVGIHNYTDINRNRRGRMTRRIISTAKAEQRRGQSRRNRRRAKVKFWFTETGGVVALGRNFPCNPNDPTSVASAERRAATATRRMFTLARQLRRDVDRIYPYNWVGVDCQLRFDSGLVRRDGSTRPAYDVLRSQGRHFRR